MKSYKAILFAPDGDYVTDYSSDTVEEVIEKLADRGSQWYFYPLEAVIVDRGSVSKRQRLVDVSPELYGFKGCSIKTVQQALSREEPTRC